MEKKIFLMIYVIAVGILLGVVVVTKQAGDPMLKQVLIGQKRIMAIQQQLAQNLGVEGQIGVNKQRGMTSDNSDTLARILESQAEIKSRLKRVEAQLKTHKNLLGQAKVAAQPKPQRPKEDFSKVYDIPVDHSPIVGSKDAKITIVEFVDFQCPFCARFHPPIKQVLKAYPKDVRVIIKNYPLSFHKNARSAAKAALAAGEQGKYREMMDALLENGKSLSEEKYKELAKKIGLNVKKFMKDYEGKNEKWEDIIRKDMALATRIGARGTPTFYFNGRKTRSRDFESFKREIEKVLKEK